MKFYTPEKFINQRVNIAVVGAGGTGGEVIDALTRLAFGIEALGHEHGLHVTLYDSDTVSDHNVGRQRFSNSDVSTNKAITLIHRVNLFYGFSWIAKPFDFDFDHLLEYDIIIGCVDKAYFRVELAELAKATAQERPWAEDEILWLDYGNGQHQGQVVLGHLLCPDDRMYLPNVYDLYPSLKDESHDNDDTPRCSLAEALSGENGQDLFINPTLADMGVNILWHFFTKGMIEHHGAFVDVATLKSNPLMVDPQSWAFFGYEDKRLSDTEEEGCING